MTLPRPPRNRFFPTGLALETLSGECAKIVKGENFVHYIALGSGRGGASHRDGQTRDEGRKTDQFELY